MLCRFGIKLLCRIEIKLRFVVLELHNVVTLKLCYVVQYQNSVTM